MLDVSNRPRVDVDEVAREARVLLQAFTERLGEHGLSDAAAAPPLVDAPDTESRDIVSVRAVTIGSHLLSVAEQHATTRHRELAQTDPQVLVEALRTTEVEAVLGSGR